MMPVSSRVRIALTRALWACSFSLLFTACGGGGGGGSADPGTPPPPVISSTVISVQPASQTVKAGTEITFTATATGEGALAYQWQRNGVDLPGATGTQYSIVTQEADNGSVWTLKVSNASPNAVVSQGATLTVTAAGPGISLLAGDVREPFVGTVFRDGTGSSARFKQIAGLAIDKAGNVFVTDSGTVRKITPNGVTTTLAGAPEQVGNVDGAGSAARFSRPSGIAVDVSGNLYVTDWDAHTVRKVTATGVVSTLAGSPGVAGMVDGLGLTARLTSPFSPAVDSSGNVYVQNIASSFLNQRSTTVRKITPSGMTTVLRQGHVDTGYFLAGGALLVDAQDRVYSTGCASNNVNTITQFNAQGDILQVLPVVPCASLLALSAQGDFYGSWDRNQIWKRSAAGGATTVAGQAGGQVIALGPLPGSLGNISAMAFGPDGSLYAAVGTGVVQIRLP